MGETGRVVPPRDPQALANVCLEILDKSITKDLAARERIERHFSLTSVLGQFASLISCEGPLATEKAEATHLTSHISPLTSH
jgi:glycosyltransferase involved in cell wall biosynthesis